MELMKRSCSVCKSKNFIEAYKQPIGSIVGVGDIGYIQHIVICKECGFCFASPILPPEIISGFYATLSNYENPQHGGYNPPEEKNKFHRAFELISKRFPPEFKGRVLDIGCSVAYGLSLFKEKGWAALGLDPSSQCAELSNKFYGVRVITSAFSMDILKSERPFDLIILSHVLEHLVSPQEMIADILELLSENGLLYIEVPNLLRPFVPMGYFSFEHLNYFTPVSLASIMGANGFSVDFLATFDNSAEVAPFYPVIASTWKKATRSPDPLMNDYDAAFSTVKNYVETSSHAVERLQAKICLLYTSPSPRD